MNKTDWQPIETAQKDEIHILGCDPAGFVFVAVWHNLVGWVMAWVTDNGEPITLNLTHWMVLPEGIKHDRF